MFKLMNIPDRRSDFGCKGMEKYWNKQTFFFCENEGEKAMK